ncbi:MAG: imidazole glycerol phosphate synthase subunit HisH [Bacteroidetes bacterium]|nr:imidazole glycerol phosphate synthase subunit HisH [Bacteroidota bacterium]
MKRCEVKVVDYRTSNLLSITKALQSAGAEVELVDTSDEINKAERLVLPGVGAFGAAMRNIDALGIRQALRNFGLSGRPMIGICLGMQLLFDVSFEMGVNDGLSLIPGEVVAFSKNGLPGPSLKIPHMGWNQVDFNRPSRLLATMPKRSTRMWSGPLHTV